MTGGKISSVVVPELAPPPGYSNVVAVQGAARLVFIAGQAAFDADDNFVGAGNVAVQAEQVFRNLERALEAAGCDVSNIVKLTVFLRDMSHLAAYRVARNKFFGKANPPAAPAVTLVEVSRLFHDEALIEIEAIAAH